jgi:hypothetical protein
MQQEQLMREALSLPRTLIDYYVSQHLAELFPDMGIVQGGDGLFDVEEYAEAGLCTFEYKAPIHNQVMTHWRGREMEVTFGSHSASGGNVVLHNQVESMSNLIERAWNAWIEIEWRGHTLNVVMMHWPEDRGLGTYRYWIVSSSKELARAFLAEVCRWNAEIRGEVLIFDGGCWHKDQLLFQSIQGATFENLILKGALKQDILTDLQHFFTARSTYEEYAIPWKRGILFVGPAGNGKTHAVKAIINAMDQPCLYVKSFRAEYRTDEDNIRDVFDRARKTAPCILVLEDLDSLLTTQNRSFFLNELDGFAANVGIVTLATTNHPERLDPAILDRPSRFDRKYPFNLPEPAERVVYIAMWNATLKPVLRLTDEGAASIAELTDGFSFAYLKELFLSSMMRWIAGAGQETMDQVMTHQVSVLHEQMVSAQSIALSAPEEEPPDTRNQAFVRILRRGSRG